MKIDDEYLLLTEIAKFWAAEITPPLSAEHILSRMWAAFWRGEFEEETGTNPLKLNVSIFVFNPRVRNVTATRERMYYHRKMLFWILRNLAGLSVEPIHGDQDRSVMRQRYWAGVSVFGSLVQPIQGCLYKHVTFGGVHDYPDPGKKAFEALILDFYHHYNNFDQPMKGDFIDNAMIERSDFLAWCAKRKIEPPLFWAEPEEAISTAWTIADMPVTPHLLPGTMTEKTTLPATSGMTESPAPPEPTAPPEPLKPTRTNTVGLIPNRNTTALLAQINPDLLTWQEKAAHGLLPDVLGVGVILELWLHELDESRRNSFFRENIIKAIVDRSLKVHRMNAFNADKPLLELPAADSHSLKAVAECLQSRTGVRNEGERVKMLVKDHNSYSFPRIPDHKARALLQEAKPPYPSNPERAVIESYFDAGDVEIHRDGFRAWLESLNRWPLDKSNLLSSWINGGQEHVVVNASKPTLPIEASYSTTSEQPKLSGIDTTPDLADPTEPPKKDTYVPVDAGVARDGPSAEKRGRGRPPNKAVAARNEKWINAAKAVHDNNPTLDAKQIAKKIQIDIQPVKKSDGSVREPLNPTAKALITIYEVIYPFFRNNT